MTSHPRSYSIALTAIIFLLPVATHAAILSISPTSNTVNDGSSFSETVIVSSADQALNAVSGSVSFPSDLLQVVSVSKANSILSLWVQEPSFSNTAGTISFSGIVPNPGYTGSRGQVFSIQFRAKQEGPAIIAFSSDSQVLANDGNGTDILTEARPTTVNINSVQQQPEEQTQAAPPTQATSPTVNSSSSTNLVAHITSSTHPDQTQWYKLSHAVFDWTNAQNISAVRLGYDKNADGAPTVIYNEPISHKELDLADGIWYFHVQEKNSSGWGAVSTYKVQIDTVPPLPFSIVFLNGTTTVQFESSIAIQFTALDDLSGIDHYQLSIDGAPSTVSAEEGSKQYALSGTPGNHTLLIQAYDKAGNTVNAETRFSVVGGTPQIFTFGWLAINYLSLALVAIAVLCTLIFAAWYIRIHFSAYRRNLRRQLGLTHEHVHKEFDNLKEAITEEILTLEQAKSTRALTQEEGRLIARFKKLLDESEREIEKDIEEIPK